MRKAIYSIVGLLAFIVLVTPTFAAKPEVANSGNSCATIQSGQLKNSAGETITEGFDKWGYNYQAHMFVGGYCDSYRDAAWCQPYKNVKLIMKWNDAWLSNKDCNGDGLLDRHYGYTSYVGSGAWLTNHQSESYMIGEEKENWNYFSKIVAAPSDATEDAGVWYDANGGEIGPSIWNEFATLMEVYNDSSTGDHGVSYKSPTGPGFGQF